MSIGGVGNTGGNQFIQGADRNEVREFVDKALFVGQNVTVMRAGVGVAASDSPDLANPQSDLPDGDVLGSAANVAAPAEKAVQPLNMNAVMKVLYMAAKELREADREIRHQQRDSAMAASMNAADKIRDSAVLGFAFSFAAGVLSGAMGAFSAVKSFGQAKALKGPMTECNHAFKQFSQAQVDGQMADKAKQLKVARNANPPDQQAIDVLERDLSKLQSQSHKLNKAEARSLRGESTKLKFEKVGSKVHGDRAARSIDIDNRSSQVSTLRQQCAERDADIGNIRNRDDAALDAMSADAAERLGPTEKAYKQAKGRLDSVQGGVQVKMGYIQGLNSAAGGVGQVIQGAGTLASGDKQAESKELDAEAQKASAGESEMADLQKSFDELIASVKTLIQAANESNNEISKSIYQNM